MHNTAVFGNWRNIQIVGISISSPSFNNRSNCWEMPWLNNHSFPRNSDPNTNDIIIATKYRIKIQQMEFSELLRCNRSETRTNKMSSKCGFCLLQLQRFSFHGFIGNRWCKLQVCLLMLFRMVEKETQAFKSNVKSFVFLSNSIRFFFRNFPEKCYGKANKQRQFQYTTTCCSTRNRCRIAKRYSWRWSVYYDKYNDQSKAIHNYRHSQARRTTENAFGIMSSYFRIFFYPDSNKLRKNW